MKRVANISMFKFKRIVFAAAVAGSAATVLSCGDTTSGLECGVGTIEQDGECVPESTLDCGDGTIEVNGECVPDPGPTGVAPTVTAVASPTPYALGGVLVIEGTAFANTDSGPLRVTIDGVEQDEVAVVSGTRAVSTLPALTNKRTVTVTITNDRGSASMDFAYTGLLASQGRNDPAGELYLVDPRGGARPFAKLTRDPGGGAPLVTYGISSLAFGPDGTLYGTEVGSSVNNASQLLRIDPETGAVTEIGTLVSSATTAHNNITDLAFDGTTLYGWSEAGDNVVTIDTATALVTVPSDTPVGSYGGNLEWFGGSLYSGTSATLFVLNMDGSVASQTPFTVNPDSTLWAMTVFKGELLASVKDRGLYAIELTDPMAPTLTLRVPGISFDALVAFPEDVLAAPAPSVDPAVLAGLDVDRFLPPTARRIVPAPPIAQAATLSAADVLATVGTADERGRMSAPLAKVSGLHGVRIVSEDGELVLTGAQVKGYRLSANQRGQLKLVNASGRTVARRISALQVR